MNHLPKQINAPGQAIAHASTAHPSDPEHPFHSRAQPGTAGSGLGLGSPPTSACNAFEPVAQVN